MALTPPDQRAVLYVSLWKIVLSNFCASSFTKRQVSDLEASELVRNARTQGAVIGVSMSDLAAPYEQRARHHHRELCRGLALRGIAVSFEDFFGPNMCNSLDMARVSGGDRLLVVNCDFEVNDPQGGSNEFSQEDGEPGFRSLFKIDTTSLKFYLFEEGTS